MTLFHIMGLDLVSHDITWQIKTLFLLFRKIYLLPQKLEEWRLLKSEEFSLIKSNDPSLRWSCKVICSEAVV